MNKTVFIKCTCHSEGIMIEADSELRDVLFLSIWERGYKYDNSFTWKQKLRYIWQVLKHGKPYGDQIVLDRKSCFTLSKALIEHAPQE
jgi:hypothetical protein